MLSKKSHPFIYHLGLNNNYISQIEIKVNKKIKIEKGGAMEEISTKELIEELLKREAIQHFWIKPYEKVSLIISDKKQNLQVNEGPARILLIYD